MKNIFGKILDGKRISLVNKNGPNQHVVLGLKRKIYLYPTSLIILLLHLADWNKDILFETSFLFTRYVK